MREKFSYNEFLDLIEKNEWQADKYKSKFIPNHMVTENTQVFRFARRLSLPTGASLHRCCR